MALLRAVGHVLLYVDAGGGEGMRSATAAEWALVEASEPEPLIYWEFIKKERDNLLKLYQFGAQQNVTLRMGTSWINLETGEGGYSRRASNVRACDAGRAVRGARSEGCSTTSHRLVEGTPGQS